MFCCSSFPLTQHNAIDFEPTCQGTSRWRTLTGAGRHRRTPTAGSFIPAQRSTEPLQTQPLLFLKRHKEQGSRLLVPVRTHRTPLPGYHVPLQPRHKASKSLNAFHPAPLPDLISPPAGSLQSKTCWVVLSSAAPRCRPPKGAALLLRFHLSVLPFPNAIPLANTL